MEDLELNTAAEGTPDAAGNDEQRHLLRRLLPEGFELHRVVKNMNCKCWFITVSEAEFNRQLKVIFLTLLIVALISVFIFDRYLEWFSRPWHGTPFGGLIFIQTWQYGHSEVELRGIIFLAIIATVPAAVLLMKKIRKETSSGPQRREEERPRVSIVRQV